MTTETTVNNNNNNNQRKQVNPKNFVWFKDLKKGFQENEKIHFHRLNTEGKLDKEKKGWVRFTPLGGLDEIGGNCAVFETEDTAIIFDCGMSFPTEDMHGVDILIPDFTYLKRLDIKLKG